MPRRNVRRQDEDLDEDEDEDEVEDIDELDEVQDQDDEVDEEIRDTFDEAQRLNYGREDLIRKRRVHTARTPKLSGGDLDADWDDADVGEESVEGKNPTPDQSDVDDEGDALGISYQDDERLHTTDKPDKRDRDPWELNPASSDDYGGRRQREFKAPLKRPVAQAASARRQAGQNVRRASSRKTTGSAPQAQAPNRAGRNASARSSRRTNAGGVGGAPGGTRPQAKKANRRSAKRS